MFSWTPYALVRIALVFIAGIIAGLYFPETLPIRYVDLLFAILVVVFSILTYLKWKGSLKYVNIGFVGIIALFLS